MFSSPFCGHITFSWEGSDFMLYDIILELLYIRYSRILYINLYFIPETMWFVGLLLVRVLCWHLFPLVFKWLFYCVLYCALYFYNCVLCYWSVKNSTGDLVNVIMYSLILNDILCILNIFLSTRSKAISIVICIENVLLFGLLLALPQSSQMSEFFSPHDKVDWTSLRLDCTSIILC